MTNYKQCDSEAIKEEKLQKIILDAINELFSNRDGFVETLRKNVEEMLVDTTSEKIRKIDLRLKDMQKELIKSPKNEALVGNRILALKKEKEEVYANEASKKGFQESVNSLMSLLEKGKKIESYSEDLVRLYVSNLQM